MAKPARDDFQMRASNATAHALRTSGQAGGVAALIASEWMRKIWPRAGAPAKTHLAAVDRAAAIDRERHRPEVIEENRVGWLQN